MPKTSKIRDLRVIIGNKIRVVLLNAIIKDGDDDALAGDAHLPRLLHAHVQLPTAVKVPANGSDFGTFIL